MNSRRPDATASVSVKAAAERVYELVSDPGALAGLASEYSGHRWLGGASRAAVGARFRGTNRRGVRRWSTVSKVTDASAGSCFAFDVSAYGIPVARWQYDIEPGADGCVVTESTWDRRPGWFRSPSSLFTGVWQRAQENQANIEATLARLKAAAEGS
ncbi:SRPBCC family protein [Amycolatopsis acididurans]|uniref:SRPBCC family protein n=1 Tax=Amycolatopsis acididurans TaxID=2724524 RepID=UPI0028A60D4A|nr:SRPBCC family protein [Amycolatopsis acididurans]